MRKYLLAIITIVIMLTLSTNVFSYTPTVLYPSDKCISWKPMGTYSVSWKGYTDFYVTIKLIDVTTNTSVLTFYNVSNKYYSPDTENSRGLVLPSWARQKEFAYKVKITGVQNPAHVDSSDNTFSIGTPKVVSPSSTGLIFKPGDICIITWQYMNGSTVNIYLEHQLPYGKVGAVKSYLNVPNTGSYVWVVPSTYWPGGMFYININSYNALDRGDYPFQIK
jgi:hypothetical protein